MNKERYDFLDVLRAVAAIAVLIQHSFEKHFEWFNIIGRSYFKFGVFGVSLFFLCSGFIIPTSLEKHGSLKRFWKGRIFRLYPLYIFSIISTLLLISVNHHYAGESMPSWQNILVNLTMLPKFLGQELILHLHWTLNFEMVFYIGVSILFILKVNKLSTFFVACIIAVSILNSFTVNIAYGTFLNFMCMFTGTVLFRYFSKSIKFSTAFGTLILSMLSVIIVMYNGFYIKGDHGHFFSETAAYLLAYALFLTVMLLSNKRMPNFMLYLGRISFSLYIMQDIPIVLIPDTFGYLVQAIMIIVSTVIIATITYYSIEKPFMDLAKRNNQSNRSVQGKTIAS
ncbi:acyltransferase family protein [Gorillibacterium sp. sgz5001074]|uniref:acyltransferase family protein n=1 Tax=Gorillibacterium sp. sgz5001074 TaxID=3446695 RepID=UPI003F67FB4F